MLKTSFACCPTEKCDKLHKTAPAAKDKDKHEQEMEKMSQLLLHKQDKCNRKCHLCLVLDHVRDKACGDTSDCLQLTAHSVWVVSASHTPNLAHRFTSLSCECTRARTRSEILDTPTRVRTCRHQKRV